MVGHVELLFPACCYSTHGSVRLNLLELECGELLLRSLHHACFRRSRPVKTMSARIHANAGQFTFCVCLFVSLCCLWLAFLSGCLYLLLFSAFVF